jgi:hypothetical protein
MNFYTHLFIGTIIFLILTLIIVGYCMSLSRKNEVYPPAVADCPDYYSLDASGHCNVGTKLNNNIMCNNEDFTQSKYTKTGTDFDSGLCKKKLWANNCDIKWDGITNNDTLCYT